MPQYYPSQMTYQSDRSFQTISRGNISSYTVIGKTEDFTYFLNEQRMGAVFFNADLETNAAHDLVPVMHVFLRDSGYKGYKQAFRLRIRESFARDGVATHWYLFYVAKFGGIVSDFEHLQGGKVLWKSLAHHAVERGYKVRLLDTTTGADQPVGPNTPDDFIWSVDRSKQSHALVLERK